MTDYVHFLPTDDNPVNPVEEQVFSSILNANPSSNNHLHTLVTEFKNPLIVGILFLVINTEQSNALIESIVGYTRASKTSLLLFKTFLFVVMYFVWQNLSVAQSKS